MVIRYDFYLISDGDEATRLVSYRFRFSPFFLPLLLPLQNPFPTFSPAQVILPASALDRLTKINIQYPMVFEIINPAFPEKVSHCGVIEFVADEGTCFLPYWMMQNLLLEEVQKRNMGGGGLTYLVIRMTTRS
jgi:hypothetical protein